MLEIYRKYLKYYKKEVILGPFFKLLEALFELLVPLIMAMIIDEGINKGDSQYVIRMGLLLFGVAALGLSTTLVCQYFAAKASQGFGTRLRNDTFRKITSLDYMTIDEYGVATLLTRMNNDINQLQLSVAMLIRLVIRAPFIVLGSSVMAFLIAPKFGLIFFAAAILIIIVVLLIMKYTIPKNLEVSKNIEDVTRITKENLSGARVVRAFNNEQSEYTRFSNATSILCGNATIVGKISALLNPLTTIIVNTVIILIIYLGGQSVGNGEILQGDVTALVNYLNQILVAVLVLTNLIVIFGKSFAAGKRVNILLNEKSKLKYGSKSEVLNTNLVYEFKNVSFKYPQARTNSINNLSINIFEGELIGIIGSTGSGKTSLINLFKRLYDCTEGEILYKGCNIKDYSKEFLNDEIKITLQKAILANDTIKNNLAWGNKELNSEDIERALEISCAKEIVEKNDAKLERLIYEGGKNLSGGEKGRLSLARALVKLPRVLLIDDSLAALDNKTELKVRQNLSQLGITIIMVSQKVSSLKNASKIIVLDNGNISGIGTHEELLVNNKVYQEIASSQAGDSNEN